MAAIAGIARPEAEAIVEEMLNRMAYRGPEHVSVKSFAGFTLGIRWPDGQPDADQALIQHTTVEDQVSNSHFARARLINDQCVLSRDSLGVAPLYYGYTGAEELCFSSEVKGLLGLSNKIYELPPGSMLQDGKIHTTFLLQPQEAVTDQRLSIAAELRARLEKAVAERANRGVPYGAMLSGGLDSSIIAALARPHITNLHTFAIGLHNAPDLEYARLVARYIRSAHHERIPTLRDILHEIPNVIFHLESFDPLLVRSSVMSYLAAKMASDYAAAIYSGEGGDGLFAGYDYLKAYSLEELPAELVKITNHLHNTALQRVDRCLSAFGLVAYLPFLDERVVEYAMKIPAEFKIFNGLEKWILRRSVFDLLPERVVLRGKARFWEGSGIEGKIAAHANETISDHDFQQQRQLPNGEELKTKEELFYYRIFKEHFGELVNADWMGRSSQTNDR